MNSKKLFILLIFIALIAIFSNFVSACSCAGGRTLQQEFGDADAVFLGTVKGIQQPIGSDFFGGQITANFDVQKSWKGIDSRSINITTGVSEAGCGYSFVQGQDFLVFAYNNEGELSTGICSGTHEVSNAITDEDIIALGFPEKDFTSEKIDEVKPVPDAIIGTIALIIILVGAVAIAIALKNFLKK